MRDGVDVGVLAGDEITEKNLLGLMTGDKKISTASEIKSTPPNSVLDEIVLRSKDLKVWENGDVINFNLPKGEILGVTGLDGQGQDNFVKALAGIDQPISGDVIVKQSDEERELTKKEYKSVESLLDAKKSGIAYVSGDRKKEGIFPNMSIYENMVIPLYKGKQAKTSGGFIGFIKWTELNGIFDWEVDRLSIKTGPKNNLITSLSGGNQQKVMIARAFTTTPKILILNDPARGIDVGAKRDLYKHLRNFVNEGGTVIFLSSELEEFIGLCHRVLVFRDGSIFETFEKEDINPNVILEGMFGHTQKTSNTSQEVFENNKSNQNDVIKIIGQPHSKSIDDKNEWVYFERILTRGDYHKLGQNILKESNVLVLNFDKFGILKNKKLFNKNDKNELKFSKKETENELTRKSFVEKFLSSIRQKMYRNK